MNAGRELDALIAEKVMGLRLYGRNPPTYLSGMYGNGDLAVVYVPFYSTEIAAAWQVVERMTKPSSRSGALGRQMFQLTIDASGWHTVIFREPINGAGTGVSIAEAICLAALEVVA